MNMILDKLNLALNHNELKEFLIGDGDYNIPSREGFFTDFSSALYMGIYECYKKNPNSNINILFEKEIINMLKGNPFEVMCAFDYCWRQISSEEKGTAPFSLSENCIKNIRESILAKRDLLMKYKEYSQFGSNLEKGAFQYVENIDRMLDNEFGRKIL